MENNKIILDIELGNDKIPERVKWISEANGIKGDECKAFFLTLFEKQSRDTLELDIWTKEMQIIEMDRFVFQTLNSLNRMYLRATKNEKLSQEFELFIKNFGVKTGILKD